MKYAYHDTLTDAHLVLHIQEKTFEQASFSKGLRPFLTLAWNTGSQQAIYLDGDTFDFPANSFLPLVANQTFSFQNPEQLIVWQFDKPFYCIQDFDHEVSCMGYLFWSNKDFFTIRLDDTTTADFELIFRLFVSEFKMKDNVQNEVQRALLKRLIIRLNHLAKKQELNPEFRDIDLDLVRQYNVLVEKNFRALHQVQDYASLLNKSPKTLTNLFLIYNDKSPLEVIHDRIVLEAKRLLLYTPHAVKEIAFQLGFEEVSHFSRLFKNRVGVSPAEFKPSLSRTKQGEIGN